MRKSIKARSFEEAERDLPIPMVRGDEIAVVSIGCPGTKTPRGVLPEKPHHLRLEFDDINYEVEDLKAPEPKHVRAIIDHAEECAKFDITYCHCRAGISRSTAAAFILRCIKLGPGNEDEALQRLLADRSIAEPNARMVSFADEMLEDLDLTSVLPAHFY